MELLRYISNQKAFAMKLKLILILIVLLSGCSNKKAAIQLNTEVNIEVTELEKLWQGAFEIKHDRQVKIFRTQMPSADSFKPYYGIYIYRKKSGVQPIDFMFEGLAIYNLATYLWVNDSTVNFKMFNANNSNTADYTFSTNSKSFTLKTNFVDNVPDGCVLSGPLNFPNQNIQK